MLTPARGPDPGLDPAALFVALCIALAGVVPSIYFAVPLPIDNLWFWYVLIAAFFGFFLWTTSIWFPFKVIPIWAFLICCTSKSIYTCFTQYIAIVGLCYFYWVCSKIRNWDVVFKAVQTLLVLNLVLFSTQALGIDTLLNFDRQANHSFGILGQHMQTASMVTVLVAFLFPLQSMWALILLPTAWFCHSAWTALNFIFSTGMYFRKKIILAGLLIVALTIFFGVEVKYQKISANLKASSGRVWVWRTALDTSNRYPWTGYGPGTFKTIFPAIMAEKKNPHIPYKTAHNFIVQLIFEMGYPFTIFLLGVLGLLIFRLHFFELHGCLVGLSLIFVDALVHFPDRMFQTVPILVAFLAYCNFCLRDRRGY